jgi:hypothetical protein
MNKDNFKFIPYGSRGPGLHNEYAVYYKNVRIMKIGYDSIYDKAGVDCYWIEGDNSFLKLYYIAAISSDDLDFIKEHKMHKTLESAKEAVYVIFQNYINWLTN